MAERTIAAELTLEQRVAFRSWLKERYDEMRPDARSIAEEEPQLSSFEREWARNIFQAALRADRTNRGTLSADDFMTCAEFVIPGLAPDQRDRLRGLLEFVAGVPEPKP